MSIKAHRSGPSAIFYLVVFLFVLHFISAAQKPDKSLITLNECWRYPSRDILAVRPVVDGRNLYIIEDGGRVSAISLLSGARLWSTELGGIIRSNVVSANSSIYVVTSSAGKRSRVRSLGSLTGIPNLEIEIPFSENTRLSWVGGRLLAMLDNGFVLAFMPNSVKPDWQVKLPPLMLQTAVFSNDMVIVASSDKKIHIISTSDGAERPPILWDYNITALELIDGDILFGDERGSLVRLDDQGRSISWRFKNGARFATLVSIKRGIVAASLDNFVYLISDYNGDIRWKKRMGGRVSGISVDNELAIVLTVGEPNAALLTIEGGRSVGQFLLPADDSFTQQSLFADDKLLFFTTAGVVAQSVAPCSQK